MRNLNEHNITDAVLDQMGERTDPRIRELITALVRHLHAFARETGLTEEEWLKGMKFLARTGALCSDIRQEFILLSDTLGLSQLVVAQNHNRGGGATEQTVFGPFHVEGVPQGPSHGSDLAMGITGAPLYVSAEVRCNSQAVTGAVVDIWQADSEGHYDVQNTDWRIENAALRTVLRTDEEGRISFRTILPISYPIPTDGTVGEMLRATFRHPMRPAHIHFRIRKPGFDELVTHVFVRGDEYLDSDAVFGVRESCVGDYILNRRGKTFLGDESATPYYTLHHTFTLQPVNSALAGSN
jgi:hydroxyquinol 1,2-dioxygenase